MHTIIALGVLWTLGGCGAGPESVPSGPSAVQIEPDDGRVRFYSASRSLYPVEGEGPWAQAHTPFGLRSPEREGGHFAELVTLDFATDEGAAGGVEALRLYGGGLDGVAPASCPPSRSTVGSDTRRW